MKKLDFFPGCVFFFPLSKIEWMNGMWTFPGKEKKTRTPIFTNIGKIKNRNSHKNRSPISAFGFYFSLVSLGSVRGINSLWFWSKNAYELGYLNWYVQFWQKLYITKNSKLQEFILKIKHLTLTRSWMNGQWTFPRKEKKTRCFFFYRNFSDLGEKKKHDFWIWMNEWPTFLSA